MAGTKIKCMCTINVNVICEYQQPVISTIVAVDTLCRRRMCIPYNLQVATQEAGLLITLNLTTWQFDQNIPIELEIYSYNTMLASLSQFC